MSLGVEVLIVSYNSAGDLQRCVESIRDRMPEATVAIREHGDDAEQLAAVRRLQASYGERVRLEFDPTNPGFGAGCNVLARSSEARWLLFLNPDTVVLDWAYSKADPPPTSTIVGPTMVGSPAGRHSGRTYRVRDEIKRSWLRRPGPPPRGSGFVSGAAMLIDANSFRRVGGFDEDYFLFYEDIDLCLRANRIGIRTVIDDRWRVRHDGGHSTRTRFAEALMWSYESANRFHRRGGSPLVAYRSYVAVDAGTRAIAHRLAGRRAQAAAYRRLARRAVADVLGRVVD